MIKKTSIFIMLFWILLAGKAFGEELTVSDSQELQEALSNDKGLTAINIKSGEYFGNFTVNHSIRLIGEKGARLIGPDKGNVLTIEADDVIVEGLQIEGGGSQNAGIYVEGDRSSIHHNVIKNVFHGIYAKDGYGHRFENNIITSFQKGKNHKGFGVYLVRAPNTVASDNFIHDTQDGIYVSYSNFCEVKRNQMIRARYGVHTMDSKNILISQNQVRESINGLMIMQSYEVFIIENFFYLNTKIDGAGMFIYDTFDSKISSNIVMGNYKGILLENAQRNIFEFNTFMENHSGLEIGSASSDNTFYLNNFYQNTRQIISDKENNNKFSKDNYGNYFDDHRSLNLNNDDFVDYAYKSGDVFYNMTSQEPFLQLFFQSPAVELWNMVEQYTPILSDSFVIDESPLVRPAPVKWQEKHSKHNDSKKEFEVRRILYFLMVVLGSAFILVRVRRERDEI